MGVDEIGKELIDENWTAMIGCDACLNWYHPFCIAREELREKDELDKDNMIEQVIAKMKEFCSSRNATDDYFCKKCQFFASKMNSEILGHLFISSKSDEEKKP